MGQSLFDRGYTHGTSGNISVLLDDGSMIVTPTNASLGNLDPANLCIINAAGGVAPGPEPTKELPLHSALYRTRGAARAIVHLHSTHSVAVSCLADVDPKQPIPPITPYYVMKIGNLVLLPYYAPGDMTLANAVKEVAGKHHAILLANHGPIVAGKDLQSAVYATEELEETAKLYLLLRGNRLKILSPEQVAELHRKWPQ